jgi:hypothetical protein
VKETEPQGAAATELFERMIAAKQLSAIDLEAVKRGRAGGNGAALNSEEEVLRWLADEYDLTYTNLENVELDRQLLSLFPARILLKEELLPLKRVNGTVEVATSRLFATQGLDALKTLTGLKLKPVLAPRVVLSNEL